MSSEHNIPQVVLDQPKEFLKAATDSVREYFAAINTMTPEQLQRFLQECESLTSSNCGYVLYRLSKLLRLEAEEARVAASKSY
ncbi:hypothetical protein [Prosthecobacter sp.]|uniref:hypothetical protein n=1 Tax=Prosthecobacter sp. TaxID=1965333 RepID=UPI0037839CD4